MGLCKCPLRKVTNLFCFEHRVNVCEHCMVNKHQKVSDKHAFKLLSYFFSTVLKIYYVPKST